MSSSRERIVETSTVEKKSELSAKAEGTPSRARAAAKSAPRPPGERSNITMSSGRQGRKLPSFSVTGKRSASSCRTRRAASFASASCRRPPSSPPQQRKWYSTAQSSRSG